MATSLRQVTFDEQLQYCQKFKPTYRGALANHVPMAIIAMKAIGARSEQIDEFIDQNRRMLEPVNKIDLYINFSNWVQYLGQRDAYYAYRKYFMAAVKKSGWQKVVTEHIGSLLGGISASAFHCLIRLGLGIRQNSPEEVAVALAFFASEYQSLGESLHSDHADLDLTAVLAELAREACLHGRKFEAPNIIKRLNQVAAIPGFQRVAELLDRCMLDRAELADFALRLFASTGSFTALHGVTSCHALRWLLPWVSDEQLCLRLYARALLCAYISIEAPKVESWQTLGLKPCKQQSWPRLFAQAIDSFNDHKIKMVFSCHEEWSTTHHEGYPWCAALALESDL